MKKKQISKNLQRKRAIRTEKQSIRQKNRGKVKHVLDQLYRDQISEATAYEYIKSLNFDPTRVAWDWEDEHN